ncbi:MAG: SMP-30/gluconolactonase/LRE family protein, partial [Phycisphaerae bacterium]|nr:SMP-30/gluconolactonase/LRE family protein [Phycisphaerae bacterium]NIX55739.1 SMP-30/gluconolactonase/LRE family protein [candidate division Zixibacteria bacterium]
MKAECILQIRAKLGENALWMTQEQRLYWLDLDSPAVHIFNPDKQENRTLPLSLPERIGCLVPHSEGGFL